MKKLLVHALVLTIICITIDVGHSAEGDFIESWPLTSTSAYRFLGTTTDGSNIWVTEGLGANVYIYDMDGNYISNWSLNANNAAPYGITTDGTWIWVVDAGDDMVYRYDMSGSYINSWALASGNDYPGGITTDGSMNVHMFFRS